ncbi:MAG: alpha/beta fold hydrolase [Candidatus Saccharimonadales bacterium]
MSYQLFSTVSGNGPTIVFLHGFLTSGHYYSRIRKRLEADHTIVTLDLLGHGRSPKPNHLAYTYQDHLDAIHHTLQTLGVQAPFVLVGHSMGALLSLRYARDYPADVSRLLLFNPPMFAHSEEGYLQVFTNVWHYRTFLMSRARKQLWRSVQILPRNPFKNRPPVGITDMLRTSAPARMGSLYNVIFKGDVFSEVHNVTLPTMIIIGKKDRYVHAPNVHATAWPSHVTIRMNELGHNGIAIHPNIGAQYIKEHMVYNK